MRQTYSRTIKFRESEALADAAEAEAQRRQVTLSELIRHALRREVQEPGALGGFVTGSAG